MTEHSVAIVGAGPAGLMAADVLSAAGQHVIVYERMPSVARKFLMAGRGGLNLTHSEPFETFVTRYGDAQPRLQPMLEAFMPRELIAWTGGLGQETFVGSSGRIFPKAMKASPLLRAWLRRLAAQSVEVHTRTRWTGWDENGALALSRDNGARETCQPAATLLALGGASWPKLGSDGAWMRILETHGVALAPLQPANVGFEVAWSDTFRQRFAGAAVKNATFTFGAHSIHGEAIITDYGLEGGAIYALSAHLRDALGARALRPALETRTDGPEGARSGVRLFIDLSPQLTAEAIAAKLARAKRGDSLSSTLRKQLGLTPVAINLLREAHGAAPPREADQLAARIKTTPITLNAPRGLDRAISSAGGVSWNAVDEGLQLRAIPGTYVAGEMLDWEAPTGGYLLQGCFATGAWAAHAMLQRINAS